VLLICICTELLPVCHLYLTLWLIKESRWAADLLIKESPHRGAGEDVSVECETAALMTHRTSVFAVIRASVHRAETRSCGHTPAACPGY